MKKWDSERRGQWQNWISSHIYFALNSRCSFSFLIFGICLGSISTGGLRSLGVGCYKEEPGIQRIAQGQVERQSTVGWPDPKTLKGGERHPIWIPKCPVVGTLVSLYFLLLYRCLGRLTLPFGCFFFPCGFFRKDSEKVLVLHLGSCRMTREILYPWNKGLETSWQRGSDVHMC